MDPAENGDYRVCFDNSFSRFSEKMVFVGLVMNGPADDPAEDNWVNTPESDSMLEYKLGDIRVRKPPLISLRPFSSFSHNFSVCPMWFRDITTVRQTTQI